MDPEQAAVEAYCQRLRDLFVMARSDRLNELRGQRSKLLDGQGLHPWSLVWGECMGLAVAYPLLRELKADPVTMRAVAFSEAEDAFAAEVAEHGTQVFSRRH